MKYFIQNTCSQEKNKKTPGYVLAAVNPLDGMPRMNN